MPKEKFQKISADTINMLRKKLPELDLKAKQGIPVSSRDSLIHQLGKQFNFEDNKGSIYGTGLPNFGYSKSQLPANKVPEGWQPPTSKEEAIALFLRESEDRLKYYPSAMEKGEASDVIFNTGKDPRIFWMDQYMKEKNKGKGLPNKKSLNVNIKSDKYTPAIENKVNKLYEANKKKILSLPENQRRILMNKARDYHYKNTYLGDPVDTDMIGVWNYGFDKKGNAKRGPDGSLSPGYKNSWFYRIWESVNDY